jgi:pyruvate kinase
MALNFPGTDLHIPSLTEKDLTDLDFIVCHADLVGYSFVQRPEDVSVLLGELDARRARFDRKTKLGIVAKIETASAVRSLPEIIVRAAGRGPFGVMIARGDLAVEVGYLRVAELQEEILWLCEAAHIPVIWATQVLETLAKKGVPTRAEITDAAMAEGAECVMLNKGPFILEAVRVLDSVLKRMAGHHRKKTATLRALHSWDHLSPPDPSGSAYCAQADGRRKLGRTPVHQRKDNHGGVEKRWKKPGQSSATPWLRRRASRARNSARDEGNTNQRRKIR